MQEPDSSDSWHITKERSCGYESLHKVGYFKDHV